MRAADIVLGGHRHRYSVQEPDAPQAGPVVALHGFGTTGYRTFRFLAPHFDAAGVPLYAPDLLGFGGSAAPDGIYSLELYAELVCLFAERLELGRPILVGHSMGGKIAAGTVAQHPDRFSGLVLINPGGFSVFARWMPPLAEAPWAHWLLEQPWFAERILPRTPLGPVLSGEESRAQFRRLQSSHYALDLDDTGLRTRLREADVPALVVWGEDDPILPRSTALRVLRDLRSARLVTIPNAGHAPMKDDPDRTAEAILRFVRERAGAYANRRTTDATDPA